MRREQYDALGFGWHEIAARKGRSDLGACIAIEALGPGGRAIKTSDDLKRSTHCRLTFGKGKAKVEVLVEKDAGDRARDDYERETRLCGWCIEGRLVVGFSATAGATYASCRHCGGTGAVVEVQK
jgi:hypothetical protein